MQLGDPGVLGQDIQLPNPQFPHTENEDSCDTATKLGQLGEKGGTKIT